MKYALVGTDEEGNKKVDLTISAERAAGLVLDLLEGGHISISQENILGEHNVLEIPKEVRKLIPQGNVLSGKKKKIAGADKAKEAAPAGGHAKHSPELLDRVFELKKAGYGATEIAEETGIKLGTIYYYLSPGYKRRSPKANAPVPAQGGNDLFQDLSNKPRVRPGAMNKQKYERARMSHDIGISTHVIGHELQVNLKEVDRAINTPTWEEYSS